MEQDQKTIGEYLRSQRELRKWTAIDLASRLAGYQAYDVSKWEREKRPLPVAAVHQLAQAFSSTSPTLAGYETQVANLVRLTAEAFSRDSRREAVA